MSALSFILLHADKTPTIHEWTRYQPFAVAELKQLRADNAALREAVNEARVLIYEWYALDMRAKAWLAAHPADEVKA